MINHIPYTRYRTPTLAKIKLFHEYLTAGAGVGIRIYPDLDKWISPVFSWVEKAQDYLSMI